MFIKFSTYKAADVEPMHCGFEICGLGAIPYSIHVVVRGLEL